MKRGARLAAVSVVFFAACSSGGPSPEEAGGDPVSIPPSSRVGSAVSTTLSPVSAATTTSTVTTTTAATTTITTSTTTTVTTAATTTTTTTAVEVVDRFVSVSSGWGYACGLRESGRLKCWRQGGLLEPFEDRYRSPWVIDPEVWEAPEGVFVSVSAGWGFACGLRPDGGVECWGINPLHEIEPPEGPFVSVSAGVEHVCGVRPDSSTECWGEPQRWRDAGFPPEGPFTDVAAGWFFTCGLRPDRDVECWGGGFNEGDEPPEGPFEGLMGSGYVCGIRPGGEAECWSDSVLNRPDGYSGSGDSYPARRPRYPLMDPPGVRFRMLLGKCGVDYDYRVLCWRNAVDTYEMLPTPEGEFIWVSYDGYYTCAVRRSDSGLQCWDWLTGEESPAPEGAFKEVWMGGRRECWSIELEGGIEGSICDERDCGLRVSGEVHCWAQPEGSPPVPEGEFKSLSAFNSLLCGVRVEGALECWPGVTGRTPPPGEFTTVSVAKHHACGLRPSGGIECWGGWDRRPKISPPDVGFSSISAGWGGYQQSGSPPWIVRDWGYSCGVRLDASLECWGDSHTIGPATRPPIPGARPLPPPEGEYEQVGVGEYFACALRVGGKVDCWGSAYGNRFAPKEKREAGEKAWGWFSYTYGDPLPVEEPLEDLRPYPYGKEGDPEVLPFTSVSVGRRHACGLRTDFAVECWSPDAVETYRSIPDYYTNVDTGYHDHVCAVRKNDGGVDCWGYAQVKLIAQIHPTTE